MTQAEKVADDAHAVSISAGAFDHVERLGRALRWGVLFLTLFDGVPLPAGTRRWVEPFSLVPVLMWGTALPPFAPRRVACAAARGAR